MPTPRPRELSYFLWNTTPDQELLAGGQERCSCDTPAGLEQQVDRLLRLPARRRWHPRLLLPTCSASAILSRCPRIPSFFPRYTPNMQG